MYNYLLNFIRDHFKRKEVIYSKKGHEIGNNDQLAVSFNGPSLTYFPLIEVFIE